MAEHALELKDVEKRFGPVTAVDRCSLDVARGEILALLGPSGCGKTTLLNLVAGFEDPDAGDIRLAGRSLLGVPANRRNMGMVFQQYALFPHMTVAANIAYGLEARALPQKEIQQRVAENVALLHLDGLERRYPAELSGGQRQRVAVARALAIRPDLLLFDEAFSALDKNLRETMQVELSLLLRRLGITAILVTHDQREAFALADRIAVMERGRIVQAGPPKELYRQPSSAFVLEFLGSTNRIPVRREGGRLLASGLDFALPDGVESPEIAGVYLRTEDLALADAPTEVHAGPPAQVTLSVFLGNVQRYVLTLGELSLVADRPPGEAERKVGASVYLAFDPARCRPAGDT
jgi:ABC-type Fe3+/spermidine/putrescine transport system ATPase subunit